MAQAAADLIGAASGRGATAHAGRHVLGAPAIVTAPAAASPAAAGPALPAPSASRGPPPENLAMQRRFVSQDCTAAAHAAAGQPCRAAQIYRRVGQSNWKWRGADAPRYHLYDPSHFPLAFGACNNGTDATGTHSVDALFVRQLLREGKSVPPQEAEVFVVPALMSQWQQGRCQRRDAKRWADEVAAFLRNSTWFRRHDGADHLLVADHWSILPPLFSKLVPGRVIQGRFERLSSPTERPNLLHRQHPVISVAYSTPAGLAGRRRDVVPFAQRQFDVSFVGQADRRPEYVYRRQLRCSWWKSSQALKDRFPVHIADGSVGIDGLCAGIPAGGKAPTDQADTIFRQSRFFMALTGDTPSTIRLVTMFESQVIPVALSNRVKGIVDVLPYRGVVPWHSIFVVVDYEAWAMDPVTSVLDAIDELTPAEVTMRLELLKRHADDVTFQDPDTTRAHTNIINAAWKTAQMSIKRK